MSHPAPPKDRQNRRRHRRRIFGDDADDLIFAVLVGKEVVPIETVHDVSISGIRMALATHLQEGETVTLTAQEADMIIDVQGEVRWCRDTPEVGVYEFGVEFDTSNMDNNILFFMSLRKYLDTFDDVPVKEI